MSEIADGVVDALADDRYRLWSRAEIVALLRDLMERRSLVTAGGDGASFVTAIIGVNPEFEELLLDWGGDHRVTERVLRSPRVAFETTLDHIRIRFVAEHGEAVTVGDAPAFRVRIPASVTRLQRRESYRLRMPLSVKATCEVPALAPAGKPAPALRLHDLSETGIAITGLPKGCAVRPGDRLDRCRLRLLDHDALLVDLEVVHVVVADGVPARFGARFVALSGYDAAAIRRFITRVERDLRSRT